jgi:hypothetical protein
VRRRLVAGDAGAGGGGGGGDATRWREATRGGGRGGEQEALSQEQSRAHEVRCVVVRRELLKLRADSSKKKVAC